ncbi:hypothetical protein [Confluentibacter citreus]|uniref:hypothetical protein n=1 Tax=Confluentibacter citreus TaxID=2007307 RepID=UPI000C2946D0|nr:hypothetical protein [Confluentibacter citreus]
MKRVLQYKLLAIFLLPLFISASEIPADKHTKQKTIKQEFSVGTYATLKIDNSYGNLNVITWDENRIVIEVTVTTSGNDEEKVINRLNDITVDFNASTNYVSAKTNFSSDKSKSWFNWGKNNNVNMKIDYIIKMPITNNVDLNNDYGNINLDKLKGYSKINCDYGKITTKELLGDSNKLSFDYTKNSYFEYIKNAEIHADYSSFTVSKAVNIELYADYTDSKIEEVENIKYTSDYGNIKVSKANNVTGKGDYLTVIIGDVYKNIEIASDYGSIKISRLMENAGNVSIRSNYTGINIGYAPDYHFSFDINLEYASLRNSDGLEFLKKRMESTTNYYSGFYGNANSGNMIKITSEYGSVSLIKN